MYLDLISSLKTRVVCGFCLDLLFSGKEGKLALILPFVRFIKTVLFLNRQGHCLSCDYLEVISESLRQQVDM